MQVEPDTSAALMTALSALNSIARELTIASPREEAKITLEKIRKQLEPMKVSAPNVYQLTSPY